MSMVAGQVTAIQTGLLVGLLEPYTDGQKLQTFFYLLEGNDIRAEMVLAPSNAESLYITTDIDPETKRDKVIWLKDLDIT